jgi:hypothetical protein
MMPPDSIKSMTLKSRQAGDAGFTSITWTSVRRMPLEQEDLMIANAIGEGTWAKFQFYLVNESTPPKVADKVTDEDSVTWTIKKIPKIKMQELVYDVLCIKEKGQ